MYYPTLDEVKRRATEGNFIPVYRELVADMETPVSAFLKINQGGYAFLLESVEGGERLSRYSFIGTDPYLTLKTEGRDAVNPLPGIQAELNKFKIIPVEGLPRFIGGAVGYLAYEVINRFEELPSPADDPLALPESFFMFVDNMLVFDHVTHKIKAISYVRLDGNIEEAYRRAVNMIDKLIDCLHRPLPAHHYPQPETKIRNDFVSNISPEDYKNSVEKIKEYIAAGEAIQVVLSQRLVKSTQAAPFEIYRALRTINPSPYMFFLDFKDFHIIGASPEILIRVEDGVVTTRPLAGTRPRGKNPEEDLCLERELRADEKEKAEHIMLVDLGRNDIGRVSDPGSVMVKDLMDVERYSHVMHLVTHVQGKLRRDLTCFDALQACFPAGTVSGAPKIRAMEIIAEFEREKRGPYAGAAGYFSYSGNMDMAISIRTMVMKNKRVYIQAGGGIVYDSVPEREYEESMNKAKALLKAVNQAEGRS